MMICDLPLFRRRTRHRRSRGFSATIIPTPYSILSCLRHQTSESAVTSWLKLGRHYIMAVDNTYSTYAIVDRQRERLCRVRHASLRVADNATGTLYLTLSGLVQRGGDWAGPQPAQAPPRCTSLYSSTPSVPNTVLQYNGTLLCDKMWS